MNALLMSAVSGNPIAFVAALISMTASEWATVLVAVIGTGGLGTLGTGYVAVRKFRAEQSQMVKTVAAEETERALRTLSGAMQRLDADIAAVRKQAAECNERWRSHMEVCPMFTGWTVPPRD